jgi:asparaginyl-tRNA synthetase
MSKASIYVCEVQGNDGEGFGTEKMPYKSLLKVLEVHKGNLENHEILVRKAILDPYASVAKAALKKAVKVYEVQVKKAQKELERATADKEKAEQNKLAEIAKLEEAKLIKLENDPSLATAKPIKLYDAVENRDVRLKVSGWVHRLRSQGKDMMFVVLRDGYGLIQCVLTGKQCHTYDALTLSLESTISVYGTIKQLPEGKHAPGGHELQCDYWELIGHAPGGDEAVTNKISADAGSEILLHQRHLVIRGDSASACLRFRSIAMKAFRDFFHSRAVAEVTPPLMVQTQAEGGSTVFDFDYYGEKAYLTQSSQLYLETVLPSIGDCYCMTESFRSEKSHTRRHLSEFTHCEGELAFINFDDLLNFIEDMLVSVVDTCMSDPVGAAILKELNPNFVAPKKPFKRMDYSDAIKWLNEHGIKKDVLDENDNKIGEADYEFGEDIPESPERRMTDTINEPILLCRFPVEIKSFYMKKCPENALLTESVDILMPGVGEIVGGSMRIADYVF